MRALLKRNDVRAVLLLDDTAHGLTPLRFAIDAGKPMYVAGRLTQPLERLEPLSQAAAAQGLIVCCELRMRTAPASSTSRPSSKENAVSSTNTSQQRARPSAATAGIISRMTMSR